MKKIVILFVAILLLSVSSLIGYSPDKKNEKEAIEKVIWEFMDGCMNKYEEDAVKKFLHPDFNGLSMENNRLNAATISTFIEYARKMKLKEPEGRKVRMSVKILNVDVVGKIGFADFEMYVGEKFLGSDFIVFLKTDGEWKFIRGVSIHHVEEGDIDPELEKEAIKKVICKSLVDAAGNYWDIKRFREGFHPGFTGLTCLGNDLEKDTFSEWEEAIMAMKIKEPEGHRQLIIGKIPNVYVLGHIGIAEVKIYYGVQLNETAYILFLKFNDGWKIVSKVSHRHL